MGTTKFTKEANHPFMITKRADKDVQVAEGVINQEQNVMGAYIHGIFDNDKYRRSLINILRKRKGLEALPVSTNYAAAKQAAFNRLADTVRQNMNMEKLREILQDA